MAKQNGLAKFAGKIDDQSFYYSKNGGYQSRKINPGMSARVKTAVEYENTRKNNSEFGGSGACAGAIVRGIPQRYRFILNPVATGMLVKALKKVMVADTTSPWGARKVLLADMPAVQDALNQMSKNIFPEEVKSHILSKITYNLNDSTVDCAAELRISSELVQEFSAKGATGMRISLYSYQVDAPQPEADGKGYVIPVNHSVHLTDLEGEVDFSSYNADPLIQADSIPTNIAPTNAAEHFGGILAVLLPYKEVGSQNYTLQELCSACWVSVPTVAGE